MWMVLLRFLQTRAQARKHYTDKVDFIQKNVETLDETIAKKRENMQYLIQVMQAKIQAQAQAAPGPSKSQ